MSDYSQPFIQSQVKYYRRLLGTNFYGSHNTHLIHGLYLKYKGMLRNEQD